MSEYINYLRSSADDDVLKQYCELLRKDLLFAHNELLLTWNAQQYETSDDLIYSLKDIFGALDYNEGKVWCDRIRRSKTIKPVEILKLELSRHTEVASNLIKAVFASNTITDEFAARREEIEREPISDDSIRAVRSLITGHSNLESKRTALLATKPSPKEVQACLGNLTIAADGGNHRMSEVPKISATVVPFRPTNVPEPDTDYRSLLSRLRHWLETGDST